MSNPPYGIILCIIGISMLKSLDTNTTYKVQSNQKMHDLYATMHIFQMALPDAFWAVWSQIFS